MANNQKEEKENLRELIEYDAELHELLVKNKFTWKNLPDHNFVFMIKEAHYVSRQMSKVMAMIDSIRLINKGRSGCIFTLPGTRRDNHMYLYYSSLSKEGIRKIIQMKAFL